MNSKEASIVGKIVDLGTLKKVVAGWRIKGKAIVFTNGCFDLLHAGHIDLLLAAAAEGDKLIVGLNTDASVQRLKGSGRPINKEQDRALLLAAQTFVDAVVLFDEDTPMKLIRSLMPDVLVKGGDYLPADIVGGDTVLENGGEVRVIPFKKAYSTTKVIGRIRDNKAP